MCQEFIHVTLGIMHIAAIDFLLTGRVLRTQPAGPKIALRFPHSSVYLYLGLCVCSSHVRNNDVMYIVVMHVTLVNLTAALNTSVATVNMV